MQILWIQCQFFQTNALKGREEAEPSLPSKATVTDSTLRLIFLPLIISVMFPFFFFLNKERNAKIVPIKHLTYMDYTMDWFRQPFIMH